MRGIDLGPALEQQIYFALRDRAPAAGGVRPGLVRWALAPSAIVASVRPLRRPSIQGHGALAIVRGELHARDFGAVAAELHRRDGPPADVVRVGQAAASANPTVRGLPRIVDLLRPGWTLAAFRHRGTAGRLARLASEIDPQVGAVVREQLPRLAVAAAGIGSATDAAAPRVLVTYDEAGSWGRLIVAAGERIGIPVIDLPHSEFVNPEVLVGARFSAIGVYGPSSRDLAAKSGFPPGEIRVVGSVRHDLLESRARSARVDGDRQPIRLVFAAQYPTARLPEAVLVAGLDATLRSAGRVAPAIVRIAPHPFGPRGLVERWLKDLRVPDGVAVELAPSDGLQDAIIHADFLVTVASQSVLEAAVVGIPAVAIQPAGASYTFPYADEGMAAVTRDAGELEAKIAELREPASGAAAVARARAAVGRHLGPMDGRAASRSADLIEDLLGRPTAGAAPPDPRPIP